MKDIIGGNVKYPCYDAEVIWIMLNTLTVNDVDEIVHDHLDIVRKSGFSFPEYESNIIQRGEKRENAYTEAPWSHIIKHMFQCVKSDFLHQKCKKSFSKRKTLRPGIDPEPYG